jgi:MFS family permease
MSGYFAGATLVPLFAVEAGLGTAVIGFLVSLTFLAPLLLAIGIGRSIDRRGARPHMLAGALLIAALPVPVLLWPSAVTLAALQVALGLGQILIMLSGQSLVAAIGAAADRTRFFGWYTMSVSGGQLLGPLLAGLATSTLGLRYAFAVGTLAATVGLLVASTLRVDEGDKRGNYEATSIRSQIRELWGNPTVRFAMAASSIVLLTLAVNQGFLPVLMQAHPPSLIAVLFSLQGLASMATRPFLDRLSRAAPSRGALLLGVVLLVMVGTAMFVASSHLWVLVTAMLVLGAGSGISQPLSMVMVLDEVEPRRRGLALGFRISANRLAQVSGPAVFGLVASTAGLTASYLSLVVLGPVLLWVLRARTARPQRD